MRLCWCALHSGPADEGIARRVGARGHAVAIKVQTKNGIFVRGQVVVNQRSVQRTARRDHTPPFFSLQTFWAATDELYRL